MQHWTYAICETYSYYQPTKQLHFHFSEPKANWIVCTNQVAQLESVYGAFLSQKSAFVFSTIGFWIVNFTFKSY